MRIVNYRERHSEAGQSLIETALVIPFLLVLVFNAINFGYFFFVAVNLAAAPRQGVEYSIQGQATPATATLPKAGPSTDASTVSYLTYNDIKGVLPGYANATVQVCSETVCNNPPACGLVNPGAANQKAQCTTFPSGATAFPVDPDPESPSFVLQRVDIQYTVTPIIPIAPFGLQLTPSLTFHRQVSMRAMN